MEKNYSVSVRYCVEVNNAKYCTFQCASYDEAVYLWATLNSINEELVEPIFDGAIITNSVDHNRLSIEQWDELFDKLVK